MIKRLLQFLTMFAVGIGILLAMGGVSMAEQEGDFTYTVTDGKATITRYTGPGGDVTVPGTIGGFPVVEISDIAFMAQHSITSIDVSEGIITIGNQAFMDCTDLQSISLPSTITNIGNQPFFVCSNLREILVSEDNSVYSSSQGVLFNKEKTIILICPANKQGSYEIPDTVVEIGYEAFFESELSSITIPYGVTLIGPEAFSYCNNITEIFVPDSVIEIQACAFENSTGLVDIVLSANLTNLSDCLFNGCTSLPSILIPGSVSHVGEAVFQGCSSLQNIYFLGSKPLNMDTAMIYGPISLQGCCINYHVINYDNWSSYTKYAKKPFCYLTIDLNDGSEPTKKPVAAYNRHINRPTEPRRNGYTFDGWYDDINFDEPKWDFQNAYVYDDITLYVKWTIHNHTARFYTDSDYGSGYIIQKCDYNSLISEPDDIQKTGHTFEGWYLENNYATRWDFTTNRMPDNDIMLYAKWIVNKYTVGFNTMEGTPIESVYLEYGSIIPKPMNPDKTGYRFDGWFRDLSDPFSKWNFDSTTYRVPSYDITLYAKWIPETYTVAFDSQGGDAIESINVQYGYKIDAPGDPTRLGFAFSGWYREYACTTPWNFETDTVTQDITLYAKWTASTYTVTFHAQGGTVDPTTKDVLFDGQYGLLPTPSRNGYTFGGWFTNSACTGSAVTGTTTVATASNHTLYAQWAPNTYTVTFNSQGGTAVSLKGTEYNTTITAPTPPTRSGYVFQGWFRQSACTTAWNFATDRVTANVTLYAKWISTTPTGVKAASASYTSVKVAWNAVPGVAGYKVYYATSSAGPWSPMATMTTPAYTCTGLVTGKYYYFMVRSYNAAKVYSAYSAVVYAKPIPATPYSVKATATSYNSIKITWGAVSGATRYEVYRATSSTGSYALVGTATTAACTNTNIGTGILYYYKVRAYHLEGSTKVYSAFSAVISAKTSMGTPATIKAIRANSSSIKVSWSAVSGATRYEVWRSTSSGGTYTLVATTVSLYYTNGGLTTGKAYYYKVRAYHLEGKTKVYGPFTKVVYAKP